MHVATSHAPVRHHAKKNLSWREPIHTNQTHTCEVNGTARRTCANTWSQTKRGREKKRKKWREICGRRRRGTARAIVRDGPNFALDRGALHLGGLPLVMREDQTNATRNVEALLERLEGV